MTEAQEKKLRKVLNSSLLDNDELEREPPWGEDGSMNAFDLGVRRGEHDLATVILKLLK